MRNFNSLVDAINAYEGEGYIEDFDLKEDYLTCRNYDYKLFQEQFTIDEFCRFEDDSDADEQSMIYAISSETYKLKGILISGHSIYNDTISEQMLIKLKFK